MKAKQGTSEWWDELRKDLANGKFKFDPSEFNAKHATSEEVRREQQRNGNWNGQVYGIDSKIHKPDSWEKQRLSELTRDLILAQDELRRKENEIQHLRAENRRLYENLRQSEINKDRQPRGGMTMALWRKMVQLVHPDRHGNSEDANEVTRWLIERRPNK